MSKLAERRAARQADEEDIPPPHLYRVSDVARLTGISKRTLQMWAKQGRIEAQRVGPLLWYINLDEARDLAETLKPGPKPKTQE